MFDPNYNPDETTYIRGLSAMLPPPPAEPQDMIAPMGPQDYNTPYGAAPEMPGYASGGYAGKYAEGGMTKRPKKTKKSSAPNLFPMLAEMLRQQGNEEDSILAHINPLEAMMLKQMGGSGAINKVTGLPEFSIFTKPWKAITSSMGSGIGAVIGNMILPGIGGPIGGAIGQGIQHKARGKSFGQGALKGAAIGAALPTGAGLLGQGANSLGMTGAGNFLTNYGAQNAILPSIGLGNLGASGGMGAGETAASSGNWLTNLLGGGSTGGNEVALNTLTNNVAIPGAAKAGAGAASAGSNSGGFFSNPLNVLALAAVAGSAFNRPKEDSPEKKASKDKRYQLAMQLTPSERAAREASMLADRQAERRIEMNKYLPEERFTITPRYRASNTRQQFDDTRKWLRYYDNPDMTGTPLLMAEGGLIPNMIFEAEQFNYPSGEGRYFRGTTKGQADKIPADLSAGEYTFPADVVAHFGDGNNEAGGVELDKVVAQVRKDKGARPGLPPKIKPLSNYFRR